MADLASRITQPTADAAAPAGADAPGAPAAPAGEVPVDAETGLQESHYEVEVKLSDLQDTDNPLHSAASFEQLGLYVTVLHRLSDIHLV